MVAVDQLEETMVELDGQTVSGGEAARRVRRERGWMGVSVAAADGEYRIRDLGGQGEVVLPIVPPRTKTTAAKLNATRGKYVNNHGRPARNGGV